MSYCAAVVVMVANLHSVDAVLEASQKLPDVSFLNPLMSMKVRKVLKRQKAKIMQFDWSADNHHVISGGQVCLYALSMPSFFLPYCTLIFVCFSFSTIGWDGLCLGCLYRTESE